MAELDVTTSGLADRLDVTPACIGNWRRGKASPTIGMLGRIASALSCTACDLLEEVPRARSKRRR
jgi:transcriptional regulator with XRE-family HTH domain